MTDTYLLSISLVRVRGITPVPRLDRCAAARAEALGLSSLPAASDAPVHRWSDGSVIAEAPAERR